MTSKENRRLYDKMKKLKEDHEDDEDAVIKLEKGKLYLNGVIVDEFNLSNQIF